MTELMRRDMIETTKAAGKSDGLFLPSGVIQRLCNTALAAHKLKERVEDLEEDIKHMNSFMDEIGKPYVG